MLPQAHDVSGKNVITPGSAAGVNESSIAGAFSQTTGSYGIFDLISGVRYDRYTIEGNFNAQPGNPNGLPAGDYRLDRDDGRLNPKVTLAAQVAPWLQTYITYAEAFRAPTIQETMLGGEHPSGATAVFFPNPFLRPEISKGWELGANIKANNAFVAGDTFRFKANYFTNDIEDYIIGDFVVTGSGAGFLLTHVLSLTGGLRFLDKRWTVGARGTIASESFLGLPNAPDPTHPYAAGYAIVDLFTSYKVNDNVTVGANLNNLFDVGYTPALTSPPTVSCTPVGVTCNAGLGRTVLFTVKTSF